MNIVFIDVNKFSKIKIDKNKSKKVKFNYFKNKLLRFIFKVDKLNDNISYLNLDEELIECLKNKKFKLLAYIFKVYVKNKFKNIDKINIIFSNYFDNDLTLKKILLEVFSCKTNVNEIMTSNKMFENDMVYISDYIKNTNIDINRFKILVVFDSIKDYIDSKILQYIDNYKFLDILITKNVSKHDINFLQNKIDRINDEFGTTIDILSRRNIQDYDMYIISSKIEKQTFITEYILNKDGKYLDLTNADQDILNENMITYEKYKTDILTIFNRLNINKNRYSKNKLGALYNHISA